jgi:SOS response regulatory protein OraA/RecX
VASAVIFRLQESGLINDEEFAVAWKRFPNYDRILVPKSLAFALEALGAPQKHSWALSLSSPALRGEEKGLP